MTEAEVKACRDLISTPRFWTPISKEEFLRRYPAAVENGRLAVRILEKAYKARDAGELQCALIVGFTFGFAPEHKSILRALLFAKWHNCRDDIVSALIILRTTNNGSAEIFGPHASTGSA
jgi:hypothetical protein